MYDSELANGIGNLASRLLAMIESIRAGVVPGLLGQESPDVAGGSAVHAYKAAMSAIDLKGAAQQIVNLVTEANGYITTTSPWGLAKAGDDARLTPCSRPWRTASCGWR